MADQQPNKSVQPQQQTAATPEQQQRIDAGKKGHLWNVVTYYENRLEKSTNLHRLENLYEYEVMEFRERVFIYGLKILTDPGHCYIIPPADVLIMEITRQKTYFFNELY